MNEETVEEKYQKCLTLVRSSLQSAYRISKKARDYNIDQGYRRDDYANDDLMDERAEEIDRLEPLLEELESSANATEEDKMELVERAYSEVEEVGIPIPEESEDD